MKAIKKLRCITITSYQDQHTEILTLSRVETYRIKSKSKRNKWLKWIGVFFFFWLAGAVSYYSAKYLPKESGTALYFTGIFIRGTLIGLFGLMVYSALQKK